MIDELIVEFSKTLDGVVFSGELSNHTLAFLDESGVPLQAAPLYDEDDELIGYDLKKYTTGFVRITRYYI